MLFWIEKKIKNNCNSVFICEQCFITLIFFSLLSRDPQKIDLFVGGVLEKKLEGSVLGPTFANIIGMQFHDLKYGDRLWYENKFGEGNHFFHKMMYHQSPDALVSPSYIFTRGVSIWKTKRSAWQLFVSSSYIQNVYPMSVSASRFFFFFFLFDPCQNLTLGSLVSKVIIVVTTSYMIH